MKLKISIKKPNPAFFLTPSPIALQAPVYMGLNPFSTLLKIIVI
jgi:hypothetical protein